MPYRDDIQQFLTSKAVKIISVPNHQKISDVEKDLDLLEKERCWLLLSYIFRTHRYDMQRERTVSDLHVRLAPYQTCIYHSVRVQLLGNRYNQKIMDTLIKHGVITVAKKYWFNLNAKVFIPAIYDIDKQVWDSPEKQVNLVTKNAYNTWTQWLYLRQNPFTRIDRDVINKYHKKLIFDISGKDYALSQRHQALKLVQQKAIAEGTVFDRKNWRKEFIRQCKQIDSWSQIKQDEKWIICRVDPFGKRLHSGITNCPKTLRKFSKLGDKVPLFEIDMVSAQPTLTAINMADSGITDTAFTQDINDGFLYERYAAKRGLNWSRAKAKEMMFAALFGDSNSSEMKNLQVSYPVLADYLKTVKTEIRTKEAATLQNYKPSVNNCIDVQRAESTWARSVWQELVKAGINFLPIHDSILVYGSENMMVANVVLLENRVKQIMTAKINSVEIKPIFKTTWYVDVTTATETEEKYAALYAAQ